MNLAKKSDNLGSRLWFVWLLHTNLFRLLEIFGKCLFDFGDYGFNPPGLQNVLIATS